MNEPKEITVKIKDEERSMKHKFLIYEDFAMNSSDVIIRDCVDQVKKEFQGEAESIKISVTMVIK
jgi:hypothetical protein